jgi:hypothetical protein
VNNNTNHNNNNNNNNNNHHHPFVLNGTNRFDKNNQVCIEINEIFLAQRMFIEKEQRYLSIVNLSADHRRQACFISNKQTHWG